MTMATLKDKVKELEQEEIMNALRECNWVMAKAARRLGITERMIGYKVRKYSIRKEGEREAANDGQIRGMMGE
jgi:transcriptional regulator with GAF, ATPase, and Fis domain